MLPLLLLALAAEQPLPGEVPLPDPVLAEHRGGFQLPGGLDIGLAVRTQTAVDGRVVLATVFTVADGRTSFTPYVARSGEAVIVQPSAPAGESRSGSTSPSVAFDPRSGITVVSGPSIMPGIAVNAGAGAGELPAGLVEASAGAVDGGTLSSAADGAVRKIELQGHDISITHLAGSAFGSAIANAANDRTIETVTSVGIDVRNASPDNLGSTFLQVGDLAADAIARRIN
jgi:hypothetical protein